MVKRHTLWMTGLPCSGKTTLAKGLKEELEKEGFKVIHLDGDEIRKNINSDLGFSKEGRKENLRRAAGICQLLNEKGFCVIASFVSPTEEDRRLIRGIVDNLFLVSIECPLEECERRDVKGMYAKARKGEIKEFTGISAPFEEPINYAVSIKTFERDIEDCIGKLMKFVRGQGL